MSKEIFRLNIDQVGNGYKVSLSNIWASDENVADEEWFFATPESALQFAKKFVAGVTNLDPKQLSRKIQLAADEV